MEYRGLNPRRISRKSSRPEDQKVYSVAEVAELVKVDKRTVMKWLVCDEDDPEAAGIPFDGWFKLPNGHIRIEEWAVLKLMNPD